MKKYLLFAFSSLLLTTHACKKDTAATPGEEQGYAVGKVVDTKGQPLVGVDVTIENTLVGTSVSYIGKTDAGGNYKIKVGQVGTYHASAYLMKNYNGKNYRIPLHADNDAVFSNAGAVRNFQWKLTGKMYDDGGYYGSYIELHADLNFYVPDPENIEYTLTPVGKLIDGSDGKVLVMHTGLAGTENYRKLQDIPLGRYTLTAVYVNNGTRHQLLLKELHGPAAYAASYTVNFPEDWYEGVSVSYNAL